MMKIIFSKRQFFLRERWFRYLALTAAPSLLRVNLKAESWVFFFIVLFGMSVTHARVNEATSQSGTISASDQSMTLDRSEAIKLLRMGEEKRTQGDGVGAEESYRAALAIEERSEPHSEAYAWCLNGLGLVSVTSGKWDRAASYFHQSLKILQELSPGSRQVATLFNNLGWLDLERDGNVD